MCACEGGHRPRGVRGCGWDASQVRWWLAHPPWRRNLVEDASRSRDGGCCRTPRCGAPPHRRQPQIGARQCGRQCRARRSTDPLRLRCSLLRFLAPCCSGDVACVLLHECRTGMVRTAAVCLCRPDHSVLGTLSCRHLCFLCALPTPPIAPQLSVHSALCSKPLHWRVHSRLPRQGPIHKAPLFVRFDGVASLPPSCRIASPCEPGACHRNAQGTLIVVA